ncbi:cysteine protease family C01A [Achlya hypogyna]|uniref:Cysteine protease family C01A n=1 Tax=Achlya hypogyna TaxID=1202772 RepID=A0A1V9YQK1_ACHHY|nr:cysteine protease family C01A [Achlya hypogyna]
MKFGTLVDCSEDGGCLWMGKDGAPVSASRMLGEAMLRFHRYNDFDEAKRNLKAHMDYIQDVYLHASTLNHQLTMTLGLNPRHLLEGTQDMGHPMDAVLNNMMAMKRDAGVRRLANAASLNWCTTNNPKGRSVCADVKSQQLCGSCWAFAATDVIETAVAIATGNQPVSLSSQQLLSCSTSKEIRTYQYCFANSGSVPSWLQSEMKWDSQNQGCQGGMTHIALDDAANKILNLASRIDWPYVDDGVSSNPNAPVAPVGPVAPVSSRRLTTNGTTAVSAYNTCTATRPANYTAAHITGWEPALNATSCATTKDPATLLRTALQSGPLAVALSAKGAFKSYTSGVYTCPAITSSDMIDHALLLVGYDTGSDGDYWILKNSYGVTWGLQGFVHVKADNMLNCGLNVFPIRALGASAGPAANVVVDGGGTLSFGGASMATWIAIACVVSVVTLVLTIVGVVVARKRMHNMHVFGTLLSCDAGGCRWVGHNRALVSSERMLAEMLSTYHRGGDYATAKRNLEAHMAYLQEVYEHARALNHQLTMKLGLNPRHIHDSDVKTDAFLVARNNLVQSRVPIRRQLQATSSLTSLNWCSTNNPKGRSVCAEVKSQKSCGSCWAFAASDLIETAVSYTTGNPPVALSSQQLLSCSTRSEVHTYNYCFANSGNVPKWLQPKMPWSSQNNGCDGGMTHIALSEAATKIKNLATRLDWPYAEDYSSAPAGAPVAPVAPGARRDVPKSAAPSNGLNTCNNVRPDNATAAHILGWEPALNEKSCADTKDPTLLLKRALASGPLAVAINAKGGFKDYKSGVYTCPDITQPSLIDHALLLVGYDTGASGDYWILKNSYSTQWGLQGFVHIKADDQLNCGLNVFPIRVLGASAGPAANVTVDGGGELDFAGLSFETWIIVGAAVALGTLILTVLGIVVAKTRRRSLRY